MSTAMPTTCLNCRETRVLTIREAIEWDKSHGPGRCNTPEDEFCGLDACEIGGFCQAREECRDAH